MRSWHSFLLQQLRFSGRPLPPFRGEGINPGRVPGSPAHPPHHRPWLLEVGVRTDSAAGPWGVITGWGPRGGALRGLGRPRLRPWVPPWCSYISLAAAKLGQSLLDSSRVAMDNLVQAEDSRTAGGWRRQRKSRRSLLRRTASVLGRGPAPLVASSWPGPSSRTPTASSTAAATAASLAPWARAPILPFHAWPLT